MFVSSCLMRTSWKWDDWNIPGERRKDQMKLWNASRFLSTPSTSFNCIQYIQFWGDATFLPLGGTSGIIQVILANSMDDTACRCYSYFHATWATWMFAYVARAGEGGDLSNRLAELRNQLQNSALYRPSKRVELREVKVTVKTRMRH